MDSLEGYCFLHCITRKWNGSSRKFWRCVALPIEEIFSSFINSFSLFFFSFCIKWFLSTKQDSEHYKMTCKLILESRKKKGILSKISVGDWTPITCKRHILFTLHRKSTEHVFKKVSPMYSVSVWKWNENIKLYKVFGWLH